MHAVCAGLDHVAAATCKPQETVGVEVAEVAGAQPAVDQGRGGRLRRVPVPGHDIVAAGTDLAGLARRTFTAVHSPHRTAEPRGGEGWGSKCSSLGSPFT